MRIPIPVALKIIERTRSRLTVVALDESEHFETVRESAKAGRMGGIIFEALLITSARKAKAKKIYTWNVRHFRMIAPDLAGRILEPGS
jgi:predicted nucleic acid-binding protein